MFLLSRPHASVLQRGGLAAADILALSVDGPAHSAALLDGQGQVIYPTIHTSDLRSAIQAQQLQERLGERIFAITFQRPNPSWTLSHLAWPRKMSPRFSAVCVRSWW